MPLGRSEAGVEAVGPDGTVARERRRAGRGHGRIDLRRQSLSFVAAECPLQGEDVALEPRQQVHAGPQARRRDLRDVDVRVDEPGHDDERAEVEGLLHRIARLRRADGPDDAAFVDLEQAIRLPARAPCHERRQETRAQAEGRVVREADDWHGGERRSGAWTRQRDRRSRPGWNVSDVWMTQ